MSTPADNVRIIHLVEPRTRVPIRVSLCARLARMSRRRLKRAVPLLRSCQGFVVVPAGAGGLHVSLNGILGVRIRLNVPRRRLS